MRKKLYTLLAIFTLTLASSITAFAAPETMPDGGVFDAEYYAQNNPDVVAVFGTDKDMLYSHYVNCGRAEGRSAFDESLVDFATKATQKLSFNPREFIDTGYIEVTIDELKADMRPHAETYKLTERIDDFSLSSTEVMKLDIFDIPMANYIYCCEFDKYVAGKALQGFILDKEKTSIKIRYNRYMHTLTNMDTGITADTEIATYNIDGKLVFTTKEGLTVDRGVSLYNDKDEGLYISKENDTFRNIKVYKMRDYNGMRVMDNENCEYITYLEFAQLVEEGKVKIYSGKSYGIHYPPLGGAIERYEDVTNEWVYVE